MSSPGPSRSLTQGPPPVGERRVLVIRERRPPSVGQSPKWSPGEQERVERLIERVQSAIESPPPVLPPPIPAAHQIISAEVPIIYRPRPVFTTYGEPRVPPVYGSTSFNTSHTAPVLPFMTSGLSNSIRTTGTEPGPQRFDERPRLSVHRSRLRQAPGSSTIQFGHVNYGTITNGTEQAGSGSSRQYGGISPCTTYQHVRTPLISPIVPLPLSSPVQRGQVLMPDPILQRPVIHYSDGRPPTMGYCLSDLDLPSQRTRFLPALGDDVMEHGWPVYGNGHGTAPRQGFPPGSVDTHGTNARANGYGNGHATNGNGQVNGGPPGWRLHVEDGSVNGRTAHGHESAQASVSGWHPRREYVTAQIPPAHGYPPAYCLPIERCQGQGPSLGNGQGHESPGYKDVDAEHDDEDAEHDDADA